MDLYKHQQELLDRNPTSELLCWSCGTGKTRASIEWAQMNYQNVLIICPKALKENWKRECEKYFKKGIPFAIMILSKEEFRKDWETLPKFESLIVDECHFFAGMRGYRKTSKMADSLFQYVKKYDPPRLLLTATPLLSSPWSIYMLAKILGHNWKYKDYKARFFQDRPMGFRMISEPRPNIEPEIALLVKHLGSVVDLDDTADIPDQIFEREDFKLTAQQNKAKKDIFEVNPIVRFTQFHQIESGTLKGTDYTEDKFFNSHKLDRIISLAESTPKIAIVCRYNLQIDYYVAELEKKFKKKVYVIQGATKDRDSVVQQVEKEDECIVIINASCSVGYELPSVGLIVFASMSFSYVEYKQMLGRFLRLNKLKKNLYIYLISGDIDEGVYDSVVNKKKSFYIEIYAKQNNKT